MATCSSDEEEDVLTDLNQLQVPHVNSGMFVSGWDDPDDLIEDDKDPHATLEREICWAASENQLDTVREILQKDPKCVHAIDRDGYTPLHKACYTNNYDMAKLLLDYNADPNAQTEFKWTPMHSACKWNHPKCVALLLQHGGDVNALSDGLQTPLHIAATVSSCRETAMTLLMDANINANALNNSSETAADIARRTGTTCSIFPMGHDAFKVETGCLD